MSDKDKEIDQEIEERLRAFRRTQPPGPEGQRFEPEQLTPLILNQLNKRLNALNRALDALKHEWKESSEVQSKHTGALLWWSKALVIVTAFYAIIFAVDVLWKLHKP